MREFKKQFVPKPDVKVPSFLQVNSHIYTELEIGSGNGEFAIQRAKKHPKHQFIAIEKSRTLFHQMEKESYEYNLPNLWIVHTNAVWWVSHFVPEKSLNQIYILYPNIYVKSRQANLRWFNRPFMLYLLHCLVIGGQWELRTNDENYYQECKLKMKNHDFVKNTQDFNLENKPCTAFERKYMAQGQICRSLVYTRLF